MTIEELKELCETKWDAPEPYDKDRPYSEYECHYLNASKALWGARHEIMALVEAVGWDISESETEIIPCDCERPVCVALRTFNAKLDSL